MKFNNKIDKDQLIKKINDRIKLYSKHLFLINTVLDVLEDYEGKKITKHIETKLRKKLPNYTIYLDKKPLYKLIIWGGGLEYKDQFNAHLCGYLDDPIININEVRKQNKRHLLNIGRIRRLKEALIPSNLSYIIVKCNNIVKESIELEDHAKKYDLQYLID